MQATVDIPENIAKELHINASISWKDLESKIIEAVDKKSMHLIAKDEINEHDLQLAREAKNTPRSQMHNI